jgi:hypothetical protein
VPPVRADPIGDIPQPLGAEAARPPLRLPPLFDEPGALEDLEVLRDGRQAEIERRGQLGDRRVARRQPREDRATRRVREGRERGAEPVGL